MRSQLRFIPNGLAVVFVCLGLISCGGGGGDSGNSTSGGSTSGNSTSGNSSGSAGPAVAECIQYVVGYSWGSVRSADIKLGGETASNARIQVIADPAVPAAPSTCSSTGPAWNSVQSLGANGTIGLSTFAQDCGQACASQALSGFYYSCRGGSCSPISVSIAKQVWNPVALFTGDNNGTTLSLDGVPATGATLVNGTLIFGIGTQANNGLGSTTVLPVDSVGNFTSSIGSTNYPGSFIDSGSNGLFYRTNLFANCNFFVGFYCPATSQAQSGVLDPNGANLSVNFTVGNPEQLLASNSSITADAELAGPESGGGVDWGLPFFFGRNIYTAIEGMSTPAVNGPWVGISGGSISPGTNQIPVVVDAGPPGANAINALYASVTLCAPGTTNCQTIDHLLVDTGASGVRVLASVLQPALLAALPQSTP